MTYDDGLLPARRYNEPVRKILLLVAVIAVAAILFQALLFGWHHHAVSVARVGPDASLYSHLRLKPAAVAEDSCEICAILHHQSASPLAFAAPPIPSPIPSAINLPAPVFLDRADSRGFHARAPPAIENVT